MSLEGAFWDALKDIAAAQGTSSSNCWRPRRSGCSSSTIVDGPEPFAPVSIDLVCALLLAFTSLLTRPVNFEQCPSDRRYDFRQLCFLARRRGSLMRPHGG